MSKSMLPLEQEPDLRELIARALDCLLYTSIW